MFCLPSRQIQTVSGPGPARTGGHTTSPVRSGPDGRTDGQTVRTHCTRAVESVLQQQANHKMQAFCLAPRRIQTDGSTDTHVYQREGQTDMTNTVQSGPALMGGRTDKQFRSILQQDASFYHRPNSPHFKQVQSVPDGQIRF